MTLHKRGGGRQNMYISILASLLYIFRTYLEAFENDLSIPG